MCAGRAALSAASLPSPSTGTAARAAGVGVGEQHVRARIEERPQVSQGRLWEAFPG